MIEKEKDKKIVELENALKQAKIETKDTIKRYDSALQRVRIRKEKAEAEVKKLQKKLKDSRKQYNGAQAR